jgi:hypothetical protein
MKKLRRQVSTTRQKSNLIERESLGGDYLIKRGIDLQFAQDNWIEETNADFGIIAERLAISFQDARQRYSNVKRMLWFPNWVPFTVEAKI